MGKILAQKNYTWYFVQNEKLHYWTGSDWKEITRFGNNTVIFAFIHCGPVMLSWGLCQHWFRWWLVALTFKIAATSSGDKELVFLAKRCVIIDLENVFFPIWDQAIIYINVDLSGVGYDSKSFNKNCQNSDVLIQENAMLLPFWYSAAVRMQFSPKSSQKKTHSSPVRASYGLLWIQFLIWILLQSLQW